MQYTLTERCITTCAIATYIGRLICRRGEAPTYIAVIICRASVSPSNTYRAVNTRENRPSEDIYTSISLPLSLWHYYFDHYYGEVRSPCTREQHTWRMSFIKWPVHIGTVLVFTSSQTEPCQDRYWVWLDCASSSRTSSRPHLCPHISSHLHVRENTWEWADLLCPLLRRIVNDFLYYPCLHDSATLVESVALVILQ